MADAKVWQAGDRIALRYALKHRGQISQRQQLEPERGGGYIYSTTIQGYSEQILFPPEALITPEEADELLKKEQAETKDKKEPEKKPTENKTAKKK